MTFNLHYSCLRSCMGLGPGACLFTCLIIPAFHLPYDVFSFALCTRLGLLHSLALGVTHCICGRPLNLAGTHLLHCSHGCEWTASHDVVQNVFSSIAWDVRFHVSHEQTMSFHAFPFNILIGGLTSCYQSMTFMLYGCSDHQPHMNRLVFRVIHLVGWLQLWWLMQRKDFTMTHLFPLS